MKIDYLSCTKMLYFAEKVLDENIHIVFGAGDSFARQFGMTKPEVAEICDQFEHDKLLTLESMSTEGEDKYGDMNSEYDYDFFSVNKVKFKEFIKDVKTGYRLRDKPFLPRDAVMSITKQIERTFEKDEIIRAASAFSAMTYCLADKTYSLTDFLFRHAYEKAPEKTLATALAEFLNPIYYQIQNKNMVAELFEYIDKILRIYVDKKDYQEWLVATKKYISFTKTSVPTENTLIVTKTFVVSLKDREIRVNDYLLKKPHATGKNMTFFEYLFERSGELLKRKEMPDYIKEEISGKPISRFLNDLGFKGEILKAFFPKRSKNECMFKKQITDKEIGKRGVNLGILMQELNLAHSKNSQR